ncbi:trehalose operon repressor [Robertmurraya kyonggiensis]|uniref:Trehalose operon repressor n=1 Tax=Robertmurraya kyonggiensis TaxID=1037680 RepID=A0A4U1CZN3_9BACI|nr:trehalose operon repressor [Robertmurraya kyonggiensis]TKC15311.1 trehalose operon repressor [Robertmurraya kyonggiensis]
MKSKYLAIYNEISKQIKSGELLPDSLLPSENELTDIYDTSRETIRKALNLLSQDGYIQKIRGKGSVVLNVNKFDFPVSGLVSFKEISQKLDNQVRTIVNELSLEKPSQSMKKQMQLSSTDLVWKVVRTREFDGQKVILDKDILVQNLIPDLTKEICADSLYEYIENKLNLTIGFSKKEIVVTEPTEEDRELLDLEGFSNVVVIKSYAFLDDATLFQFTESRHRPDKFRFVDFARRNH